MKIICPCGTAKQIYPYQRQIRKYCSKKCLYKFRKGNGLFIKGHIGYKYWLGRKLSKQHKDKLSISHKSLPSPNKGRKFTQEWIDNLKKSHIGYKDSIKTRKKKRLSHLGSKSHNWRGGINPKNMRIRKSLKMKLWREKVFKRDNWICKGCGQIGGALQAHHIKKFSLYPELRFDINNGQTLCMECHKKTDNYLNRKNIREEIPNSF